MVKWTLKFNKQAGKDSLKLKSAGLKQKADEILGLIENDPCVKPPPYEPLLGKLKGFFSRRINRQHRIVYKIFYERREIEVCAMFRHYQD